MNKSAHANGQGAGRVLASVLTWGNAGVVLEYALKVALIRKTEAIGNISQLLTLFQGVPSQIDALVQLPALRSQAGMATKGADQLVAAEACFLSQLVQGNSA